MEKQRDRTAGRMALSGVSIEAFSCPDKLLVSIQPRWKRGRVSHRHSRCFCGSTPDPKPPRLETPHSCGGPCTRTRACSHPCSLNCHPGPCPPCQITIQLPCYCGHQTMSFRCSHLAPSRAKQAPPMSLSCGRVCNKKLNCGNHSCLGICHEGPCLPCPITRVGKCYCGREEKELRCGEGVSQQSFVRDAEGEHKWVGEFACDNVCDRYVHAIFPNLDYNPYRLNLQSVRLWYSYVPKSMSPPRSCPFHLSPFTFTNFSLPMWKTRTITFRNRVLLSWCQTSQNYMHRSYPYLPVYMHETTRRM